MSELDFPVREYQDRIVRLQEKIKEKGLDVLIVLGQEAIHYLSGFDCAWCAHVGEFSGIIVPPDGDPKLLIRSLESKTLAKHWLKDATHYMYDDCDGPWEMLTKILQEYRVIKGTIGVEEGIITIQKLDGLRAVVPEAKIVNAGGLVESVMAAPSELETDFTRRSGKISQAGLDKAVETIGEGVPLHEVISKATEAMYAAGMTEQQMLGWYMLAVVWGGPEGGEVHETDVTRKIQKGDIITPQLRGTYKHYVTGATGSVYVGKSPPSNVTDAFNVAREMYLEARGAMKPGAKVCEAWQAANKVHRNAYGVNYSRMLGARLGVGFVDGLGMSEDILKPGVTYLTMPLLTDPLCIGVGASVMVTPDGSEEITRPRLELTGV